MAILADLDPTLYAAARRWVQRCLVEDGSLFSDDPVWTAQTLNALHTAVFATPDKSGLSFIAKLRGELEGTDPFVVQLMAELLYVHLLVPSDIRWETKRDAIQSVLAVNDHPMDIPDDLLDGLRQGLARAGVAYRTQRYQQLRYFVEVMQQWKDAATADRERMLSDPWALKAFLADIPPHGAHAQGAALLHLVHPESFEGIVSRDHKRQIVQGFRDLVPSEAREDVDRALLSIRTALERETGQQVNFYDEPHRARWDPTLSAPWDELARWASIFLSWKGFDEAEYDYKVETAGHVETARTAMMAGEPNWPVLLARAVSSNNLVDFRVADTFNRWVKAEPTQARQALDRLWDVDVDVAERIDEFAELCGRGAATTGARLSVASVLLLAEEPESYPPFRSVAVGSYYDLTKQEPPSPDASDGQRYEHYRRLVDAVIDHLGQRDIQLRGRLDAQALLWSMTQSPADGEPIASLPPTDRAAFLAWRGDPVGAVDAEVSGRSTETNRRRRRLAQIAEVWREQQSVVGGDSSRLPQTETMQRRAAEADRLLSGLAASGSIETFAAAMRDNEALMPHVRAGSHHMFVQGLGAHAADVGQAAMILERAYRPPATLDEAVEKVRELSDLAAETGKVNYPAASMAGLAASAFWHMQEPRWVPLYRIVERVLEAYGWLAATEAPGERYRAYASFFEAYGADDPLQAATQVEALAAIGRGWFAGLDPFLVERCEENLTLLRGAAVEEAAATSERNASALLGDLKLAGRALNAPVGDILGRTVHSVVSQKNLTADGRARADGFLAWRLEGVPHPAPDIRLWVTADGVAMGLYPGNHRDWHPKAWRVLADRIPQGYERLEVRVADGKRQFAASDTEPDESRQFLIGRWLPRDEALGRPDLSEEVLALVSRLRPAVEALVAASGGTSIAQVDASDDPLAPAVRRFIAERGYPDARARQNASDRAEFARTLEPAVLGNQFDLHTFRQIINSGRYGSPGPQSVLNSSLGKAAPEELERIAQNLDYLLWGEDDDATRIDALLDKDRRGLPGLGESVVMKLLAITHPNRYLPAFPVHGPMGKRAMLDALDLSFDPSGMTAGQVQVRANDLLRERLDEFFPGDTFAMKEFLYWLRSQSEDERVASDVDRIAEAAAQLHVDEHFLRELVELLEEKGQIILYGPPGTGKTYLAQRLARALVDEERHYRIVQFHPSYSYEDFFEGYRPVSDDSGHLTYELVKGPLAQMAEAADAAPGAVHVMVIDEINRANLPKVFGELLFLLEYRDQPVHTQYRPDEPFSMPKKLYFIGTMNTADRSIALIDAALRRRFHFVPFFPHEGPMRHLLRRWLEDEQEPTVAADLLDMVNDELRTDLGGPHLQVGPSHFMRRGLREPDLERIWKYSVHPYIEEQLFGDEDRIRHYTFDAVWRRFSERRGEAGLADAAEPADPPDLEA
jgi:5-methylcytosine-specific restriction enzyme B